ncbi:LOW QUALITY PROTEIN: uncharacterized protein LOC124284791 [Haliotis rubra]|uniref:LOW QUALITY PROTEIN: uncharacterized protein LOC124284791 n=1 Tax=Haliotis rubra TaxID=36100 RepID=UPI001EE5E268|nr:LOW QUALITY PROTEIN: uncharacterized protein LOC124284791 [Haliotis rubra]
MCSVTCAFTTQITLSFTHLSARKGENWRRTVIGKLKSCDLHKMAEAGEEADEPLIVGVSVVCETSIQPHLTLGCLVLKESQKSESLSSLRCQINAQIRSLPSEYIFVTSHRWPVERSQESSLHLQHILTPEELYGSASNMQSQRLESKLRLAWPWALCLQTSPADCPVFDRPSTKRLRQLSFRTSKDTDRQSSVDVTEVTDTSPDTKQLLISYVRAEAADHALKLKEELSVLGFSVYLDVHEIKSGVDWQDSLNDAVSNCEVFVPLVTPRYGETQWTNREVKLADVLGKYILPVNFLDTWPPRCLAIQFATTQYICWKSPAQIQTEVDQGKGSQATDIRIWDRGYIEQTASQIGERLEQLRQGVMNRVPSLTRRKTLMKTFAGKLPEGIVSIDESVNGEKALVVICVHPNQTAFAKDLRQLLEGAGLGVWCTAKNLRQLLEGGGWGCGVQQHTNLIHVVCPQAKNLRQLLEGLGAKNLRQQHTNLIHVVCPQAKNLRQLLGGGAGAKDLRQLLEGAGLGVWCTATGERDTTESESDTLPLSQDSKFFGSQELNNNVLTLCPSNQKFQEFADRASVVIIILSQAFSRSRTCQQQVFYCEHRKRVIPVKFEEFRMPGWLSMLIGTNYIESVKQTNFGQSLLTRVQRCTDPSSCNNLREEFDEVRLTRTVNHIKGRVGQTSCVYISGSTKFYNTITEAVCRSIGSELAQLPNIAMATGGFFGVGETVSLTFYEESQRLWRKNSVWHVLPERDNQDRHQQARQNPDLTFGIVPFGKTIFCGDSVRERENVVARTFDVCILIEGGPGAAHEAEQFVWNDHVVIPVRCTGGAAGGKFSIPDKIFEVPHGVSEYDWSMLGKPDVSAIEIGQSVSRIVQALFDKMSTEDLASQQDTPTKVTSVTPSMSPCKTPSPSRVAGKPSLTTMRTVLLG